MSRPDPVRMRLFATLQDGGRLLLNRTKKTATLEARGSNGAQSGPVPFEKADRWARELRRRAKRHYGSEEEHVPFPSTDLRRIVLAGRATSPTLEDVVFDPSNTRTPAG
jgi:hypothetical protein